MKYDKNKAFPYPVLRPYNDDFVGKDFQASVSIETIENEVEISVEYSLSSKSIRQLIENYEASFVTVIACRDTYYSATIESFTFEAKKQFDQGLFRGEVSINKYIRIIDSVELYTDEIHSDFGEGPFIYNVGDIIAQDEPERFYFEREYFKAVTSVFNLVKSDSVPYGEWKLDAENNHIGIQVNPAMKEVLDIARSTRSNQMILINSLYYAAVVQAIDYLKEGEGAYDSYQWAHVIRKKITDRKISLESHHSTQIATAILERPFQMLCESIFKTLD